MSFRRLPVREYLALCKQVYERDGWKCRVCKSRENLTPHHIIYRSQGGPDTIQNMLALCMSDHEKVHSGKIEITGIASACTFNFK